MSARLLGFFFLSFFIYKNKTKWFLCGYGHNDEERQCLAKCHSQVLISVIMSDNCHPWENWVRKMWNFFGNKKNGGNGRRSLSQKKEKHGGGWFGESYGGGGGGWGQRVCVCLWRRVWIRDLKWKNRAVRLVRRRTFRLFSSLFLDFGLGRPTHPSHRLLHHHHLKLRDFRLIENLETERSGSSSRLRVMKSHVTWFLLGH